MHRPIVRVGIGTDLHRLGSGEPLIIAGVAVPHDVGPIAHSDGDVVLHALVDALLGAIAGGDIGELFPDDDPANKAATSDRFVVEAMRRVREAGFSVANVDAVVHCQRPKLRDHKTAMRDAIAGLLGVPTDAVNVKAKTGEHVDAVGRGEAIGATVIVGLCEAQGVR